MAISPELDLSGRFGGGQFGLAAHETCGGTRVIPNDPEHSYLYRKVVDSTPCEGARMPHSGMIAIPQPLPDAQIAVIHDWIANGAAP